MSNKYHDIKFKGVQLPPLSTCKTSYFDLDAEGVRSWKTGVLRRNRIRSKTMKIECSFLYLQPNIAEDVLDLITDSTFTVNVYDKFQRKLVDKVMYIGDVNTEDYETVDGTLTSISFNLIEV